MLITRNMATFALSVVCACALSPVFAESPGDAASLRQVDYATEVLPLLQRSCLACHNAKDASGELVLENTASMLKGGATGAAIDREHVENSLLLRLASGADEPAMPPEDDRVKAPKLTAPELETLKLWISQGAKDVAKKQIVHAFLDPPARLNAIHAVAVSPSGATIVCGRSNHIHMYHPAAGANPVSLIDDQVQSQRGGGNPAAQLDDVQSLAFNPMGDVLVSGGYKEVKFWKQAPLEPRIATLPSGVSLLGWGGADADKLLCRKDDGNLVVFRASSGETLVEKLGAPNDVSLARWVASSDDFAAYSPTQGLLLCRLGAVETRPLDQPVFSPKFLATGESKLWAAIVTEDGRARIVTIAEPVVVKEVNLGVGVQSVDVFQDELLISDATNALRVWPVDADTAKLTVNHGSPIKQCVGFTGGYATLGVGGDVKFWAADGRQLVHINTPLEFTRRLELLRRLEALTGNTAGFRKSRVDASESERLQAEKNVAERTAKRDEQIKLRDAKRVERDAAAENVAKAKTALQAAETAEPKNEEAIKQAQAAVSAAEAALKPLDDQLAAAETVVKNAETDVVTAQGDLDRAIRLKDEANAMLQTAEAAKQEASTHRTAAEASPIPIEPTTALVRSGDWMLEIKPSGQIIGHPLPALLQPDIWSPRPVLARIKGNASGESREESPVNTAVTGVGGSVVHNAALSQFANFQNITFPTPWRLEFSLGGLDSEMFNDRVTALAFSPDGALLAAGTGEPSRSGRVVLVDAGTHTILREIASPHSDMVLTLAFSSDSAYLASGGADRMLKVWNVADGRLMKSFEGHTHHVTAASWQADRYRVLSGSADATIKIWDLLSQQQERTIGGFGKEISSLRMQGATEQVLATSGDSSARAYRAGDGGHLRNFPSSGAFLHAGDANWDGEIYAGGGEDGVLSVWNTASGALRGNLAAP